jgi:hypothetical protein
MSSSSSSFSLFESLRNRHLLEYRLSVAGKMFSPAGTSPASFIVAKTSLAFLPS